MELPYPARPGQQALIDTIHQTQSSGRHAVLESPTGTGKTIAALVASFQSTAGKDEKLVYATRTNSQQTQVIAEHHAIRQSGQDPGLLVPFMGRRHYCPLLAEDERFKEGSPEELGRLCRDAKRKAVQANETGEPVKGACPYYATLLRDGAGPVEGLLRSGLGAQELGQRIAEQGSCPYEALKGLLPRADAVVLPYIFLIDDRLRATMLGWLGVNSDQVHVLIDEAHNFPTTVQEHHSPRLGAATLQRAVREAELLDDPVLAGRILSTSFLHAIGGALLGLADEFILADADDGLVPRGTLEERLMQRLRVPSTAITQAAADLETWGDIVRERKREAGKLPRSYLGAVGAFLHAWWAAADAPMAHLIERDPLSVEAYLLDARPVLGWMHEYASTVQMSGTLAPVAEQVARTGLPHDTIAKAFPNPFNPDNMRIIGLHGVHRRWQDHQSDPIHASHQQDMAVRALTMMAGRTALWFPSYAMLDNYLEEGFLHGLNRRLHVERPDMSLPEAMGLVQKFAKDEGGLLLGVLGGRLSEGIDFPGDAMEHAIIFGIPYPRPTARLQACIHHQDRVHEGKGWTYAVHNPVGRRMRQAIGRLVRGPEDIGTALILDERIARFHEHLAGLVMIEQVGQLAAPPRQVNRFQGADSYVH